MPERQSVSYEIDTAIQPPDFLPKFEKMIPIDKWDPQVVERNYKFNILQSLKSPLISIHKKIEIIEKEKSIYESNHKTIALLFADW